MLEEHGQDIQVAHQLLLLLVLEVTHQVGQTLTLADLQTVVLVFADRLEEAEASGSNCSAVLVLGEDGDHRGVTLDLHQQVAVGGLQVG